MPERMENKMDTPVVARREMDEAMKKPMDGEMDDPTDKEMKAPISGGLDDATEKGTSEPMRGDVNDSTEMPQERHVLDG